MTAAVKSGVVALVVTRGAGPRTGDVLRAITRQTLAPDACFLIGSGADLADEPSVEGVDRIETPKARNLGQSIAAALKARPSILDTARWLWILHDDSIPEPTCLDEQWRVADQGRTIGMVGAKQLAPDGVHLLEVGLFATSSARRLDRIMPGEIDQGQYDGTSDVLAVGTAGMLVDTAAWREVGGLDSILGPFGDGLDFGRRLHRAGYRVVLAPRARVLHERASLSSANEGDADSATEPDDSTFADRRFAQLYNWAKACPAWMLPLLMAWLVVWSPVRAIGRVITGSPALALPEITAHLRLVASTGHLLAARVSAARTAKIPARALKPLESTRAQLTESKRLAREPEAARQTLTDPLVVESRRAYRRRSAIGFLVGVGVPAVLALAWWWGSRGLALGGGWRQTPATWTDLWAGATSAWMPGGDGIAAPADPMLLPLALVAWIPSLFGVSPHTTALMLLFAAGPASAASAWLLASRFTHITGARIAVALIWAGIGALTVSQSTGRLSAAVFHVVAPLAAHAFSCVVADLVTLKVKGASDLVDIPVTRRTGATARTGLWMALLAACAPGYALVLVPLAIIGASTRCRRAGTAVTVAMIPALAHIGPYVVAAARTGAWRALATITGGAGPIASAPSWAIALGVPARPANDAAFILALALGAALLAGAVVAALAASDDTAKRRALVFVAVGALINAGAVAVSRLPVGLDSGRIDTAWVGPTLTLGALALVFAVLVALPTDLAWDSPDLARPARALGVLSLVGALALGGPVIERLSFVDEDAAATSTQRLASPRLTFSGVPVVAVVSEQAQRSDRAGRVLRLDATADLGEVRAQLWRSAGPAVTDSTSLTRARALGAASNAVGPDSTAESLSRLALTLVAYPDEQTVAALADHGIDSIVVPDESAGRDQILEALNRASGLEKVGPTDAGHLFRVRPAGLQPARARLVSDTGWTNLASIGIGVEDAVAPGTGGLLVLAERADSGWRATLNGAPLTAVPAPNGWSQAFTVESDGHLAVDYVAWWAPPWRIGLFVALGLVGVAAVPWRRKQ